MPTHKILLITPPSGNEETNLPRWVEKRRQKQQPLGLAVIGSQIVYEMKETVEVKILDYYSEIGATIEDVLKAIREEEGRGRINIIAISCSSFLLRQVYRLVRLLKSDSRLSGIKIAVGGPATNYYYEEIKKWRLFDAIFIRNGNLSFLEYVRYAVDSQPLPKEGVFVLVDGAYEGSLPSEEFLIKSVQSEVPIDYGLFSDTYGFKWEGGLAAVFTSYGCPYDCAFCSEADSLRYYICNGFNGCRKLDVIRKEVESLRSLGYSRISIVNDSFFNETNRWEEIIDIIEENRLEFEIRARVDQLLSIGDKNIRALVDKGLRRILVGVESSSDESLAFLKKGITTQQIKEVFGHLAEAKRYHKERGYPGEFSSVAYIMLGLKRKPATGNVEKETFLDILKSIWLPFKLEADYAHYATLVLYPGTSLYREWLKEEAEDHWQRFYENPDMSSKLPSYPYRVKRSIVVSFAYFLFYLQPRFWRIAIKRMLK